MRACGYSLVEIVVTLGILLVLAGFAVSTARAARDGARARGAAQHMASLLHLARMEALKRHAHVAIRFEPDATDFRYAVYADGNRNGVRALDIDAGVDRVIRPPERLSHHSPGVGFALDEGVAGIDAEDTGDTGAVRVGRSGMISFGPAGTSTSGTMYLLGRGSHQFAVRVLGPTGRVRLFEYRYGTGIWETR